MSDYSAFFLMKPEDVKRYAVEVLHFFQPEEETDCVEIGDGKTKPEVTKTADKSTANVGDKVTYTIKLENGEFASVAIKDAVLIDTIPNG